MINSKVTHRYAKALLDLAINEKQLDVCLSDMTLIKTVCSENNDFSLLLKSPIVNTDKKTSIISQVFENKLSKTTSLFLKVITSKKREALIPLIAENFIRLHKTHNKIATAKVTTATPLDKETRKEVTNYVKSKTNFSIELIEEIDDEIIGGTIIQMGDQQLDGSIRRNIKELKNTYNKNLYIKDF
jgi:F-type H+-transporting ATPase subunit delta